METQNNQQGSLSSNTESKGNKNMIYIVIGIVIVLVVGIVIYLSSGSGNESSDGGSSSKSSTSSKNGEQYTDQVLAITSQDGTVSGKATLNSYDTGSISVIYSINLSETLPENFKCYECASDPEYNHECGIDDKYNYGGDLRAQSGDADRFIRAQAYPVFCDDFQEADGTFEQRITDLTCILETTDKEVTTDKYVLRMQTSFDTLDDFYNYSVLDIYDTKATTLRDSCVDGDPGSSSTHMDVGQAVDSGTPLKSYNLEIEEI